MEDEAIEGSFGPARVFDFWGGGLLRGDKRPMLTPLGTLLDPLAQGSDLGIGQTWTVIGLGHELIGILGEDATHELGVVGVAGNDRALAGLTCGEGFVAVEKGDFTGGFDPAMACGAMLGEEGADVAVELGFGAIGPGCG